MASYSLDVRNNGEKILLRKVNGKPNSFIVLDQEKYIRRAEDIVSKNEDEEDTQAKLQTIYLYLMAVGEQVHAT